MRWFKEKQLKKLDFPAQNLGDDAMLEFARIPSLENLHIYQTAVTANGIAALKPLKFLAGLNISGCKSIDDSAVPALRDLKLLRELNVNETAITDAGFAQLQKALPRCRISR